MLSPPSNDPDDPLDSIIEIRRINAQSGWIVRKKGRSSNDPDVPVDCIIEIREINAPHGLILRTIH